MHEPFGSLATVVGQIRARRWSPQRQSPLSAHFTAVVICLSSARIKTMFGGKSAETSPKTDTDRTNVAMTSRIRNMILRLLQQALSRQMAARLSFTVPTELRSFAVDCEPSVTRSGRGRLRRARRSNGSRGLGSGRSFSHGPCRAGA